MDLTTDESPTVCDLYESLSEPQRRFLGREFKLVRRVPASLAFLRSVPYPLGQDTADAIAALVRNYVYPWPDLRARYLLPWVCDRLAGEEGVASLMHLVGRPEVEIAAQFADPEEYREYREGTDFSYSLTGVRDAEVEDECASLRQLLEAAAEGGLFRLGLSVPLPVPLGPPSLTRVPLVDGEWIDRHLVGLVEWFAELVAAGYRRMPALDPHPLAWHRLYPPGTDWLLPTEADREKVAEFRQRAEARLNGFRGRAREIDGRAFVHFDDYARWGGRVVPGDLLARRTPGLVVTSWNAWIDAESDDGRLDLYGVVATRLDHPGGLRVGCEYAGTPPAILESAERLRSAAVAELRELAVDRTVRTNPADILTHSQVKIIDVLRRRPWLTADELAVEVGCDRSRLYQRGGLNELTRREPPIVILRTDGRRYALADVPSDLSGR